MAQSSVSSDSMELSPEATAGFILGFVVLGFGFVVMACYLIFLTGKVKVNANKIYMLERHPKLQKTEADLA